LDEYEDGSPSRNKVELEIQKDPERARAALDLYFDDRTGWFYDHPFTKNLEIQERHHLQGGPSKRPAYDDPDEDAPF
jgi:hypothetical protein